MLWIFVVIVMPVFIVFVGEEVSIWCVAAAIAGLWIAYNSELLPFAKAGEQGVQSIHRLMVIIPLLALFCFAWGLEQGIGDLKSSSDLYTVQMKSGEAVQGILLRTFDKGILVRQPIDKQVEFLKWDEISKLYHSAPAIWQQPLSCYWLGWLCAKMKTVPSLGAELSPAPHAEIRLSAVAVFPKVSSKVNVQQRQKYIQMGVSRVPTRLAARRVG